MGALILLLIIILPCIVRILRRAFGNLQLNYTWLFKKKGRRCQEPVWGIPPMANVMRKEAQQNAKAWSGFRGSLWLFLNSQKPELSWFYCTVLSTLLPLKGINLGLLLSLLHVKRMSEPPLMLSNLPNSWGLLQLVHCLQPPKRERHKA